MMEPKRFRVTELHMKLLPQLWFGYDAYTEFGAPEVDPKRPYGNSDVYGDIAEILGIVANEDEYGDPVFIQNQMDEMLTIHKQMTTVLNIMVRNNGVAPGDYEASAYGQDWRRV